MRTEVDPHLFVSVNRELILYRRGGVSEMALSGFLNEYYER
jgi:hypothetical protein